jgi:hypothetical protein
VIHHTLASQYITDKTEFIVLSRSALCCDGKKGRPYKWAQYQGYRKKEKEFESDQERTKRLRKGREIRMLEKIEEEKKSTKG